MKNSEKIKRMPETIGIIGSDSGAGVTHFSIMLAGYIASKERRRVAVAELNDSGAFTGMGVLYCGKNYNNNMEFSTFDLDGVDYFCKMTVEHYAQLYNVGYEYIIVDMGHEWKQNYYEFLRCSKSVLIGNCNEWNVTRLEECISAINDKGLQDNIYFLSNFGNSRLQKQLEKQYRITIQNIPFIKTPFELNRNSFTFFKQFM